MLNKLKIALYVFFGGFKCLLQASVQAYKKAQRANEIHNIHISLQVVHKDETYETRNLTTRTFTTKEHKDIKYK